MTVRNKNRSGSITDLPELALILNDRNKVQEAKSVHGELSCKRKDKITGIEDRQIDRKNSFTKE